MEGASRFVLFLAVALASVLGGCASGPAAHIYLVENSALGRAVFLVSPRVDKKCTMDVDTAGKETRIVSCSSDYLIGCDVTVGDEQPFCHLVSETAAERESAYPQGRR